MKRIVGWLFLLCLVVACSEPDEGPPLGAFAAITKAETDPPFNIVPPTSKSPAAFSYTSSNSAVATVAGSLVTIRGPGQSTITASQGGTGGFGPTSASTTLTVTVVPCETGSTRINGVCTVVPTCVAPATLVNNVCVAPASDATMLRTDFLAWSGVSRSDTWDHARAYCASTTIEGVTPWRLPTQSELVALQASGLIAGHNWALGPTWTSDMGTTLNDPSHMTVNLATGAVLERADTGGAYVSCVH
jgi:hypothetical protein